MQQHQAPRRIQATLRGCQAPKAVLISSLLPPRPKAEPGALARRPEIAAKELTAAAAVPTSRLGRNQFAAAAAGAGEEGAAAKKAAARGESAPPVLAGGGAGATAVGP